MIKCATWNACSVLPKRLELIDFLRNEAVDLLALTETHLKPEKSFFLPEHTVVRLDRLDQTKGGVLIAIRRSLAFKTLSLPDTQLIEAVGIQVPSAEGNIDFISVYCPKQARDADGSTQMLQRDLRILTRRSARFIIAGDLNARHQEWGNVRANKNGRLLWEDSQVGSYTVAFPFRPTYHTGNSSSTIDIFLTNISNRIDVPTTITGLSSDHLPVTMGISASGSQIRRQQRNYREADWLRFEHHMGEHIDASPSLVTVEDIDAAISRIVDCMREAEIRAVPLVHIRDKVLELDAVTKRFIRVKNSFRRRFQRTGDKAFYSAFRQAAKLVEARLIEVRNNQFANRVRTFPKCSRPFWRMTKVLKEKRKPIPILKNTSTFAFTPSEKPETLASHFALAHRLSPFEDAVHSSIRELSSVPVDTIEIDRVTCGEVLKTIKYSVSYKAPGPDGIFNVMLKHVSYSTAILLTRVFNRCLELGYFPKVWKLAKVVPVLKPGKDPCSGSSYRPISLLSAISKIFERIIHTRLETHVSANNILPDVQFGFRRQRSAAMQLQRVMQIVSNAKTSGKSTGIALLDVEKAFDSVWHNGLIYKLRLQGFPSYLVHLVQNYLSERKESIQEFCLFHIVLRLIYNNIKTI